jgi:large subunit ribosomal protein L23
MGILDRFKSKKERELKGGEGRQGPEADKAEKAEMAEKPKVAPKKKAKAIPADLTGTILRPLVTEKAAVVASQGQYSFVVAPNANRVAVRAAVKAMYGVLPTSVNIQRVRGKAVRFGRSMGQRAAWKKAIVTLPKGKTIDVYEGV